MDLTTLAARDTATITLRNPATDTDLEGATVTLYGPGTAQYQAALATQQQTQLSRMMAAGKAAKQPGVEQLARERAAMLAACTASISGWDYKGGTDAAALRTAYADPSIGWVADQVDRALKDWTNFLPSSTTA